MPLEAEPTIPSVTELLYFTFMFLSRVSYTNFTPLTSFALSNASKTLPFCFSVNDFDLSGTIGWKKFAKDHWRGATQIVIAVAATVAVGAACAATAGVACVVAGAAIGAATGVAAGLVIGFASGDDPDKTVDGFFPYLGSYTYIVEGTTAGEKAASWAVGLGIAGTVVGALVGSKKEVFLINGDISKYQMYFDEIRSYSLSRK